MPRVPTNREPAFSLISRSPVIVISVGAKLLTAASTAETTVKSIVPVPAAVTSAATAFLTWTLRTCAVENTFFAAADPISVTSLIFTLTFIIAVAVSSTIALKAP